MALKVKPKPGSKYTIVRGDTLWAISGRAFGKCRQWPDIWEANKKTLRSGDPNMIYPGEVIWIPPKPPDENKPPDNGELYKLPHKNKEDFTITVDGKELPCSAGSLTKSMTSAVDAWSVSVMPYELKVFQNMFKPFMYQYVEVFLGGSLQLCGRLYTHDKTFSAMDRVVTLSGNSFLADALDSTCPPPFEMKKVTLKQRAEELLPGFHVVIGADVKDIVTDKVTIGRTETIFSHLSKLAQERECIITTDFRGYDTSVYFEKAAVKSEPVEWIAEGVWPFSSGTFRFDGRKRFQNYHSYATSPGRKRGAKGPSYALQLDSGVTVNRSTTVEGATSEAKPDERAAWAMRRAFGESVSFKIPLSTWTDSKGRYWKPNTLLTVASATAGVPYGYDFLITDTVFSFGDSGPSTELTLTPPAALFGLKDMSDYEDPWRNGQQVRKYGKGSILDRLEGLGLVK